MPPLMAPEQSGAAPLHGAERERERERESTALGSCGHVLALSFDRRYCLDDPKLNMQDDVHLAQRALSWLEHRS